MFTLWRLVKSRRADDALTGIGCDYAEMRWNYKGTRMVYTSESKALCALELMVNVNYSELADENYTFVEIKVPASVKVDRIKASDLPDGWQQYPSPSILRDIGQKWIDDGKFAILEVPSAVTEEKNYLINPSHPDTTLIKTTPYPFSFDKRLLTNDK